MLPPLVKLATSAVPGEAKYVCLAGAGLSKDAGLPTAWDLMLETAALLVSVRSYQSGRPSDRTRCGPPPGQTRELLPTSASAALTPSAR
jgi:hypothetical protein